MASVVCFGEALIDFLAEPAPGTPRLFAQYAGGAPANVAVAAAKLGASSAFVGMLAEDQFGDFLLGSLREFGVSTKYTVRTRAAHTGLAFVSLDANGERRFSFYRPPAADLLFRPQHFDDRCFAGAAIFHACSNSLTEAEIADTTLDGMRRARAAGVLVSFDMNLRLNLWSAGTDPQPRIWRALHMAELVKLSATELEFLAVPLGSETAVLNELWRGHAQWLLVTDGAAPLRHFTRTGSDAMPSFTVQAVNATAAGDAFVGGLLSRLAHDQVRADNFTDWLADAARGRRALRFAAACGALAATRHGAFAAMPALPEVERFLAARA